VLLREKREREINGVIKIREIRGLGKKGLDDWFKSQPTGKILRKEIFVGFYNNNDDGWEINQSVIDWDERKLVHDWVYSCLLVGLIQGLINPKGLLVKENED
jgi:hypothetical protein